MGWLDTGNRRRREMRAAARVAAVFLALIGVLFIGFAFFRWHQARELSRLAVTTPEDAVLQQGRTVLVHGVATTDEPLHEPGIEKPLLFVEHTTRERTRKSVPDARRKAARTRKRTVRRAWVASFSLGPLRVQPAGAETIEVPVVRTRRVGRHTWRAIAAGTPLTVLGTVHDGQIAGGDPFIVTPLPPERLGSALTRQGVWMTVVGAALLLVAVVLFVQVRSRRGADDETAP